LIELKEPENLPMGVREKLTQMTSLSAMTDAAPREERALRIIVPELIIRSLWRFGKIDITYIREFLESESGSSLEAGGRPGGAGGWRRWALWALDAGGCWCLALCWIGRPPKKLRVTQTYLCSFYLYCPSQTNDFSSLFPFNFGGSKMKFFLILFLFRISNPIISGESNSRMASPWPIL
jgi:hypothetical protein